MCCRYASVAERKSVQLMMLDEAIFQKPASKTPESALATSTVNSGKLVA